MIIRCSTGIANGADFYFVHSYAGTPAETADDAILAETEHGARFVSAVARGNLLGVQFHPERSGDDGLRLLANFVSLVRAGGRAAGRRGVLMLRRRVIPCLDVADGRVVKGTRFVDLVDEGDPPELAERYAREGADELVFLDITAAPERRGTLLDIVERTARRAFIPLTVGGGVRSVDEMRDVLRAGADKVSLNTAAVAQPELVTACARRFGSQAVVVAIDALRNGPSWTVYVKGGREATPHDAVVWAQRAVELGAGELLVTSIDRDGTGLGFDTELLRAITDRVTVPVIASGGAAGPADFVAAVRDGGADAVLAASIFHRRIHSIASVKSAMAGAGLRVRATSRSRRDRRSAVWRRRARPGDRPGRRRRAGADACVDGRGGAERDRRDRRGPLPFAIAQHAVAEKRDERQRAAPRRHRAGLRSGRAARHR